MTREQQQQAYRNDRCEDLEWLLQSHEHPERIAHRMGYRSVPSLTAQLHRWGRSDLVARLGITRSFVRSRV